MTDRFTEATIELEEKNAFECETCDEFYHHGRKERNLGHADRKVESGKDEKGSSKH